MYTKQRILWFSGWEGKQYVGRVMCYYCGTALDKVSLREAVAIQSGRFGFVLCPVCAMVTCSGCGYQAITEREQVRMRKNGGLCTCCALEDIGLSPKAILALLRHTSAADGAFLSSSSNLHKKSGHLHKER